MTTIFLSMGCAASSPDESYRKMLSNPVSTAYPELMAHFPAPVPADARVIDVSHFSGWGTRWAAHMEGVDARFAESLRQWYPRKDAETFDVGSHVWLWLAPTLHINGTSTDYDTIMLKNRTGNHGHRAGVSISKNGRNAVFWAERW